MRIRLLPSSGPGQKPQLLTTFIVDGRVAIDAGSIALDLTADEWARVRHVLITHSHSDHTALLPVFVAEAYTWLSESISVHAIPEIIDDMQRHIFNDRIWPDFQKISVPSGAAPSVTFNPLALYERAQVGHLGVTPIPVNHTVPCTGLVVDDGECSVVFTSDTYATDEIWEAAAAARNLKAVYVDVSFPNELESLAEASRHFTPKSLAADLNKMPCQVPVFAVHIKPSNRDDVIRQLAEMGDPRIAVAEAGRTYEF